MLHLSLTSSPEKILECPDTISTTALNGAPKGASGKREDAIRRSKMDFKAFGSTLFCTLEVILNTYPVVLLAVEVLTQLKTFRHKREKKTQ